MLTVREDEQRQGRVPVNKVYRRQLEGLRIGEVENVSAEYYTWNSRYYIFVKHVATNYSVHLEIYNLNPSEDDKVGDVIFEAVTHTHASNGHGSAMAHNSVTTTYGQWVFFYQIASDCAKNEDKIQLVKLDLNDIQSGVKPVGDQHLL